MNKLINLTVLSNLCEDKLINAFLQAYDDDSKFNIFMRQLFINNAENDFSGYVSSKILLDENVFSVSCASGKEPSIYLKKAYVSDVKNIINAVKNFNDNGAFAKGEFLSILSNISEENVNELAKFYKTHGYGKYIENKAFTYKNELIPVKNTDNITLSDLKNYELEKQIIGDNIDNFLNGLPFSHMLLYGDRGTGKSSTIHAMLNKHFCDGLRIIEVEKENLLSIPQIKESVSGNPLKFIIFIDDLSFGEYDERVSSLKAVLEGSVSGNTDNCMIVATSNRRHIVKESFDDRSNSIHPNDSIEEQLSLSDRFGITVNFSTTDKLSYLSIVKQLASDMNIKTEEKQLELLAERWALVKGGRSPRRAKQFVELLYSCEQKGTEINF